jgi:hypothetical protein
VSVRPAYTLHPSLLLNRLIDGKKIDSLTKDDTTLARKPMYGAFSVSVDKGQQRLWGPRPKVRPQLVLLQRYQAPGL